MKYKEYLTALLPLTLTGCVGCAQVEEGERGIETNYGKIVGEPLGAGLHFYNPFSSDIEFINVREHKLEGSTNCFTSDTQQVAIEYAVTFYPDPAQVGQIYRQYGMQWEEKVVPQTVLSAVKDAIGEYKADDLVQSRAKATASAEAELKAALSSRGVLVTKLDLKNLDFDDSYEQAVEAKVVATQRSIEAKNKTVQVEEEAKQTILSAEAEAKAMKIKSQALAENKGLVDFEAVQKWDGKLPEIMMGGTTPFINMDSLRSKK